METYVYVLFNRGSDNHRGYILGVFDTEQLAAKVRLQYPDLDIQIEKCEIENETNFYSRSPI